MKTKTEEDLDQDRKNEGDKGNFLESEKRHPTISPVLILDVDKGLDFTFDGLGLTGNRVRKS